MKRALGGVALCLGAGLLVPVHASLVTCPTTDPLWCYDTGGSTLSAPAASRAGSVVRIYLGNGTQLLALDPSTGGAAAGFTIPTVGTVTSRVMPAARS